MPLKSPPSKILLKLSGQMCGQPFDASFLSHIARQIRLVSEKGVLSAIVCGGGNIFRGAGEYDLPGLDREAADRIGMLATAINGLAIEGALKAEKLRTALFSALPLGGVCETFTAERAREKMAAGHIVLITGGTGNPFFTTDTAGMLRACELECDLFIKGTKTDGIYDSDPATNASARKIDFLSFEDTLEKRLKILDASAFNLAHENNMPIVVCSLKGDFHHLIGGDYPHSFVGRP